MSDPLNNDKRTFDYSEHLRRQTVDELCLDEPTCDCTFCNSVRKDEREKIAAWLDRTFKEGYLARAIRNGEYDTGNITSAGILPMTHEATEISPSGVCEWELEDAMGIGAHYHTGCTADVVRVHEKQGPFCPRCGKPVKVVEAQK